MALNSFETFKNLFFKHAAMFKKNFVAVQSEFGESWDADFDAHLEKLFKDDESAYRDAIQGYVKFSLSAMRLQQRFNLTRKYEDATYQEVCERVYLDEGQMMKWYLPGIFVSHFLWKHHYRQFLFHQNKFLPLLDSNPDKRFYEVGTGTGFYTVQLFRRYPQCVGHGIDISPHSRQFTSNHVKAWGPDHSFVPLNVDINIAQLEPVPCIQSIEVLEHLSDPQLFLNNLRKLLKPGGYGFIAAAITAPEVDHIYLYWSPDDVIRQLNAAGFTVLDFEENPAYEGQPDELVPKVAAFIVS